MLATGVQVVTDVETETPQIVQAKFTHEKFSEELLERGLPAPSTMDLTCLEEAPPPPPAGTDSSDPLSASAPAALSGSPSESASGESLSVTAIAAGVGSGVGVILLGIAAGVYLRFAKPAPQAAAAAVGEEKGAAMQHEEVSV